MRNFEKSLLSYRIGEVQNVQDDILDIPVSITTYYDDSFGTPATGYRSTPLIIYTLGMKAERVGTLSDEEIVSSMLRRGYIACVLDYLDDERACMPRLDFSMQKLRRRIFSSEFFGELLPSGTYSNSFVVPSGYDVSLSHVYYEMDKYCVDGTIEKVVETWNNDFRGTKGEKLVKWTDASGARKKVAPAFDGAEPMWFNADGTENENGDYTKVKYTVARNILDCVQSDGSPLDFNLYIHFIYPTAPKKPVPVICLASSSEHLAAGASMGDRPQAIGAALRGYASVMFDYGYVPMARNDHYGYFDGYPMKGAVTGDNWTYSLHHYNAKNIDTAAMRYIRYANMTNPEFHFDTDHIGVYGNSKGGCFPHLGEKCVETMRMGKFFNAHHGESRLEGPNPYAYGYIQAAAEQPWQTYNGEKIPSHIQYAYASCGGGHGSITDGHCATFVSMNLGCPSCYRTSVEFVNVCRSHDVPTLWFEVDQGHTLASANDVYHNINTYSAYFDFAGYVLKGDPAKVLYADMERGELHVKFVGVIPASEAEKITLKGNGVEIPTRKSSLYGNTEWILTPMADLPAGEYTVTVPAEIRDERGKSLAMAFEGAIAVEEAIPEKKTTSIQEVITRELPLDSFVSGSTVTMIETIAPDGTPALAITEPHIITQYAVERFYNGYALMSNPTVIKEGKLNVEDIGRRFTVSFKVWDCESRYLSVSLNGCTNGEKRFNDYRRVIRNVKTLPAQWVEVTLDYTVYEPEHGEIGEIEKKLLLSAPLYGNAHKPIYFKDFIVKEYR